MENRSLHDVGGTPGGLGSFLIGFVMACVGGYLLANQVSIVGSYWRFYAISPFGITLLPMLIGVGVLFCSDRNIIGWLLTMAGTLFILAGVIANMHILFSADESLQHAGEAGPVRRARALSPAIIKC